MSEQADFAVDLGAVPPSLPEILSLSAVKIGDGESRAGSDGGELGFPGAVGVVGGAASFEGGFIDFAAQGAEVSHGGVAGVGFAFCAGGSDLLHRQLLARVCG